MPIPKTKFRPPILRQPLVRRPRLTEVFTDKCPLTVVSAPALMIAGPCADHFGSQLWFLIAEISCMLMGILGFFSSDVMGMENKPTDQAQHVIRESS